MNSSDVAKARGKYELAAQLLKDSDFPSLKCIIQDWENMHEETTEVTFAGTYAHTLISMQTAYIHELEKALKTKAQRKHRAKPVPESK